MALGALIGAYFATTFAMAADQSFPSKPLKLVVPTGPGSASDTFSRMLATALGPALGQPVIVENRIGANGIIGAEAVARSPGDGYTILAGNFSTHAANPALYRKLPYDPIKDFAPIAQVALAPYLLVVGPDVPAKTFAELVAVARAQPGKLTYASGSAPSIVGMEAIKRIAGIDVLHIPYKTVPQAVPDVVSGKIDMIVADTVTSLPQIRAGKLRPIANVAARRTSLVPDVPSMPEVGVQGLDVIGCVSLYAAAGTPKEAIDKLVAALRPVIEKGDIKERMAALGLEVIMTGPAELATYTAEQIEMWGRLIKEAGIKPE